jgi:hypothetical protein
MIENVVGTRIVLVIDASRGPFSSLLPFCQRFPLPHQVQIVVALPNRDGPEAELLDSVLLKQSRRVILKAFQQGRQPTGNGSKLMNHVLPFQLTLNRFAYRR